MSALSAVSAGLATGLVPILPPRTKPVSEEQAALEIELLRRRQLRREDVRKLLLRRAERKVVAR